MPIGALGVGQIGRFGYADHISSDVRHKGTHCRHIELGRGTEAYARATVDHITSWPERQRPQMSRPEIREMIKTHVVPRPSSKAPDGFATPTSITQQDVEQQIQKAYASSTQPLTLHRMRHFNWLKVLLYQGLPAAYKSQDASQPWILFWIVQSFQLMGAGLDPGTKQRAIDTIMKCQHPDGGFGGGPKQEPGVLPTYAAISALVCVGRPGPGGGWDDIDRYVGISSRGTWY